MITFGRLENGKYDEFDVYVTLQRPTQKKLEFQTGIAFNYKTTGKRTLSIVGSTVDLKIADYLRKPWMPDSVVVPHSNPIRYMPVIGYTKVEFVSDNFPTHPRFVQSLRDQCKGTDARFVFAGWGQWPPEGPVSGLTMFPVDESNGDVLRLVEARNTYVFYDGTLCLNVHPEDSSVLLNGVAYPGED